MQYMFHYFMLINVKTMKINFKNQTINSLLKEKDISVNEISERILTTRQNFTRIFKNETLKIKDFVNICNILNCNPNLFFECTYEDNDMYPNKQYSIEQELLLKKFNSLIQSILDENKILKDELQTLQGRTN